MDTTRLAILNEPSAIAVEDGIGKAPLRIVKAGAADAAISDAASTCIETAAGPDKEIHTRRLAFLTDTILCRDSRNQPGQHKVIAATIVNHLKTISGAVWHATAGLRQPVRLTCSVLLTISCYCLKHPFQVMTSILLTFLLWVSLLTGSHLHDQAIQAQISDRLVEEILSFSRFTRNFDADGFEKDGAREALRVGAPRWAQAEAVRAVLAESRRVGLSIEDQAVLLATVEIESGFNPWARAATSSACGLFQFIKDTGQSYSLGRGDCMDPRKNARVGIQHYLDNFNRRVQKDIAGLEGEERMLRLFEYSYYLHHDGPASSNPSAELKALVLDGSYFLFKAYRSLKHEASAAADAPTYADTFAENVWQQIHMMGGYFESLGLPGMTRIAKILKADPVPSAEALTE